MSTRSSVTPKAKPAGVPVVSGGAAPGGAQSATSAQSTPVITPNATNAEGSEPNARGQEVKEKTRIFVGNLKYETTEKDLRDLFKDVGEVVSVHLSSSSNRPRYFAFVLFKTEEAAANAVQRYNNCVIDGREISVEYSIENGHRRFGRSFRGGRGRGRGRGARREAWSPESRARIDNSQKLTGDQPARDYDQEDAANSENSQKEDKVEATPESEAHIEERGRGRGRGRRPPRRSFESSTLSETILFVANLPYSLTSEELLCVFKEYDVVNAEIVTFGDGVSKGYGFVELTSHEEQQRVIKGLQILTVGDRRVMIKPAIQQRVDYLRNKATALASRSEKNEQEKTPAPEKKSSARE